ncbi:trimeric intracellular cation channel family protein [Chromobacterium sphagni]|nr:trimeric intracellular cation channel family protein [Chromobacterium sphagni]
MEWFSAIGTAAFAFSGYLVGFRKRLDLLGICIIALVTAIGGGVIRDLLVGRVPLVFYDYTNLIIIVFALLAAWLSSLHKRKSRTLERLFIVADSLGLVAFSLAGAQVGLLSGLNAFGVVSLGFVTAVGGGVVRDMMVNDVPFILHRDFYGTVSILMAGGLFLADRLGWVGALSLQVLFWLGLALRLLAHRHELTLPRMGGSGR